MWIHSTIIKHEVGIHAVTYFLDKQLDSEFQQHARRLFCYIDDIAFIWTGTLTECQEFINVLNSNNLHIRLTPTFSPLTVDFLDLKLTVVDGAIQMLHRKDSATNNLQPQTYSQCN